VEDVRNLPNDSGSVNAPPTLHLGTPPWLSCSMMTRLRITGMSCQHCVQAVFTALTPVGGITSAKVTIGAAVIEHDGQVTLEALREAIAVAGYEVEVGEEERRRLPLL
jgi:copper chaperone